jgi:hypothetical protein
MLSLILVAIVVGNVFLWQFQMNQADWERMQEKVEILDVISATSTASTWYRVRHNITGSSAGAQANYQVSITIVNGSGVSGGNVYYTTHVSQLDFDDVRFTWYNSTSGQEQAIPYWREAVYEGANATFWVKVPEIPASPASATIYVYYGNSTATTASSESATFVSEEVEAFVDVPYSKWGTGPLLPEDTYNTWYHDARNEIIFTFSDFLASGKVPIKVTAIKFYCYEKSGQPLSDYRIRYQITTATEVGTSFTTSSWTLVWGPTTFTPTAGTWYTHDVADFYWTQNNLRLDLTRDGTSYTSGGGMYRKLVNIRNRMLTYRSDSRRPWPFDGIGTQRNYVPAIRFVGLLRNYVSPEPTHGAWGSEEACENTAGGGVTIKLKNEGSLTVHVVSLWVNNATVHKRYDVEVFINPGETLPYTRADVALPEGNYIIKVVTERGNIAVYSKE